MEFVLEKTEFTNLSKIPYSELPSMWTPVIHWRIDKDNLRCRLLVFQFEIDKQDVNLEPKVPLFLM